MYSITSTEEEPWLQIDSVYHGFDPANQPHSVNRKLWGDASLWHSWFIQSLLKILMDVLLFRELFSKQLSNNFTGHMKKRVSWLSAKLQSRRNTTRNKSNKNTDWCSGGQSLLLSVYNLFLPCSTSFCKMFIISPGVLDCTACAHRLQAKTPHEIPVISVGDCPLVRRYCCCCFSCCSSPPSSSSSWATTRRECFVSSPNREWCYWQQD